jgi:hypothetical protein
MGVSHPRQLDPYSCADSSESRVAHSAGPLSREWAVASRVARSAHVSYFPQRATLAWGLRRAVKASELGRCRSSAKGSRASAFSDASR